MYVIVASLRKLLSSLIIICACLSYDGQNISKIFSSTYINFYTFYACLLNPFNDGGFLANKMCKIMALLKSETGFVSFS